MIPLLVSDLDDTLLTSDKTISPKNKASIEAFRQAGGQFTIATGRNLYESIRYIKELELTIPAILANGSLLYDPLTKETTILNQLDRKLVQDLYTQTSLLPKEVDFLIYSTEIIYGCDLQFINQDVAKMYDIRLEILDQITFLPNVPILKLVGFSMTHLEQLRSWTETLTLPIEAAQSSDRAIEILPIGVNKGSALELLVKRLGLSLDHVAAVGDQLNDLSMLRKVGHSFAVANANPLTIQTAKQIVPSHNEDAIHHIIQEYLTQTSEKAE
ncbi:Cof-type HAD-IIB family hydrolase [Risungbinella massiliensis]|uniref:Cof-type HAD-IIB family hydrolase n=1 Tax=Risungbinella massiliensis TaxID=1329796 RepID=UPI0005CBD1CD|nr:Cof-type HAD-IIB family hydrolase [Risungbinella massiliensis]